MWRRNPAWSIFDEFRTLHPLHYLCGELSVLRVNPEFPGPKQAGPDAQRFRSDREKAEDEWVLLCSQCKRCEMACPCGVEPAQIILMAQQRYGLEHPHSLAHLLFANNYYLSTLGSLTAPIANMIAATEMGKKAFRAMGISTHISFPKFRFRKLHNEKKNLNRGRRKVAFFYGCFINFYRPDIGRKIIRLLSSLNVDVVLPPQWCCGLPALGNGNLELARSFAEKNAASLSNYIDAGYDVIYTCTSCGLCLLHDYPGILEIPQGKKSPRTAMMSMSTSLNSSTKDISNRTSARCGARSLITSLVTSGRWISVTRRQSLCL